MRSRTATPPSTAASSSSATNGGATYSLPVQIDKPGQFADNPNPQDKLNPKKFRAPISPSLVFNPVTGSLNFAYENNVNRQTSGADISFQQSRNLGATWSDAKTISTTAGGAAAPNDQYFPWLSVDEAGNLHAIWFDNRNDPQNTMMETFQAFSSNDGATWRNWDISSVSWEPGRRVLQLRLLHRRLQRHRCIDAGRLPGVD
jgi:hypothetical protein